MGKLTSLLLMPFAFTVGCVTTLLSEGGQRVRVVRTSPHNCKYVGQVVGQPRGLMYDDITPGALDSNLMNDIKNNAALIGGNTVEVTLQSTARLTGEAYYCEYN